ncbi:hypothetical protein F4859DRAFT_524970 [Xylaria cf. heliscus]|nr:hypothetical protein F4859DRAFT_524970 [Xylaria cf. heliscus]
MAQTPVLRFPISGQEDGSFLLEVLSNGSRPLDLKLVGSESTAVFVLKCEFHSLQVHGSTGPRVLDQITSFPGVVRRAGIGATGSEIPGTDIHATPAAVRHKKIDEYKASPGHCTDEEWQQILTSLFVDLKPVPDIEVRADVQSDGSSVTLSFRKNIQGITQRVGSIKLDENDRTEISPFDWCVSAIASRSKVTDELAAATAKIESLEHTINELQAQLDDFITTKEEDETQMLEKFRDLLNEKKLKIRQQQRLIAAANVDPEKLANIGGGSDQDKHRNAGPSRSNKRKVSIKQEESESEDGFEEMDIDNQDDGDNAGLAESGSDVDEIQELGTEDDATASDPDTDDEPPTRAEVKRKGGSPAGRITKPKVSASRQTAGPSRSTRAATQKQAAESDIEDEDDEPPPSRTLPFMRGKQTAAPKPTDDDETQSDDDDSEL